MAFDRKGERGGEQGDDGDRRPGAKRPSPPSTRPRSQSAAATERTRIASAAIVPSPGSRAVAQQIAQSSANPTAGASQDQRLAPQSASAACPIASEAPQTARTAA